MNVQNAVLIYYCLFCLNFICVCLILHLKTAF